MTKCWADGNQNPRNIMVLKTPNYSVSECVCWMVEGGMAAHQFAASGNLMFQTDLRYEFLSEILNEG